MKDNFKRLLRGYRKFRSKYANGNRSVMRSLSHHGQQPDVMVVACCDSRVDPALILQCDPGDLFVVRNVANIIPPYEKDEAHHGTSAALEFGICFLKVKHLILLGHSQCSGIQALFTPLQTNSNDFISNWVSLIQPPSSTQCSPDDYARIALHQSYEHCLSFPWIQTALKNQSLTIDRWFFDIKTGQIFSYSSEKKQYILLDYFD